jgi:hypothetical protein
MEENASMKQKEITQHAKLIQLIRQNITGACEL